MPRTDVANSRSKRSAKRPVVSQKSSDAVDQVNQIFVVKHTAGAGHDRLPGNECPGRESRLVVRADQLENFGAKCVRRRVIRPLVRNSLYQRIVWVSPLSRSNRGCQPSSRRALAALRYWWMISLEASLRTSGSRSLPIRLRRVRTRSRTVTWISLEKLNASPFSSGREARASARTM